MKEQTTKETNTHAIYVTYFSLYNISVAKGNNNSDIMFEVNVSELILYNFRSCISLCSMIRSEQKTNFSYSWNNI